MKLKAPILPFDFLPENLQSLWLWIPSQQEFQRFSFEYAGKLDGLFAGQLIHHAFFHPGSEARARVVYCLVTGQDGQLYPVDIHWHRPSPGEKSDDFQPPEFLQKLIARKTADDLLLYAYRYARVSELPIHGDVTFWNERLRWYGDPHYHRIMSRAIEVNCMKNQLTRAQIEYDLAYHQWLESLGQ